jgi:hypothetical protein
MLARYSRKRGRTERQNSFEVKLACRIGCNGREDEKVRSRREKFLDFLFIDVRGRAESVKI